MHTVNIILEQSNTNTGNELDNLPHAIVLPSMIESIIHLYNFYTFTSNRSWLDKSIDEAKKYMISDINLMKQELYLEIRNTKKIMKQKFPIRYRIEIFKTVMKKPLASLFGFMMLLYKKIFKK